VRNNNGCAAATGIGEHGGVRLGKLCTSLRSLCLPACDKLTPPVLEAIVQGCTRLVSLNVGHTGAQIGQYTESLVWPGLPETKLRCTTGAMVTDEGLGRLLSAQELHRLCISGSNFLTPNGVAEALHSSGRRLLDLDMRDCAQLARGATATLRRICEATAPWLVGFNNRLLQGSKTSIAETLMLEEGPVHRQQWSSMASKRRCSLRRTGHIAVAQPLYHCLTCAIVGQVALCSVCAMLCHQSHGHSVVFYCNAPGVCDCAVQTMDPVQEQGKQHTSTRGCQCLWGAEGQ
jgi:hypothetical protein